MVDGDLFFGNQTPKNCISICSEKVDVCMTIDQALVLEGGGGKNVEWQSMLGQWTSRDPEQARYIHTGN